MKKTLLLLTAFVFTFSLTSCSSDDDNSSQDPFVGTWKYFTYFEDGVEYPLDDCESQDTFVISSNGTFQITRHDEFGGECQIDIQVSGTWENLGNGTYSSTTDGDTYVQNVIFEGNKMFLDDVEDGVTFRDVFVRQ